MSDKLQKNESAIKLARNIGEEIARAVEIETGIAEYGLGCIMRNETIRIPPPNSSDLISAVDRFRHANEQWFITDCFFITDPSVTWESEFVPAMERARALATRISASTIGIPLLNNNNIALWDTEKSFTTDAGTCVWGDHSQCTGARYNGGAPDIMCKCSCEPCLTAQRRINELNLTDERTCITLGDSSAPHYTCEVVSKTSRLPVVCLCDCIDCKRAWFSDGRPVVRDGVIVRTTPESVNPVKTTAEDVARWERLARFSENGPPPITVVSGTIPNKTIRDYARALALEVDIIRERVRGESSPADMLVSTSPALAVIQGNIGCRRCSGLGYVSVPGELADRECEICDGMGEL